MMAVDTDVSDTKLCEQDERNGNVTDGERVQGNEDNGGNKGTTDKTTQTKEQG